MKLKNIKSNNTLKKLFKKHEDLLEDVILFGSSMKGKYQPKDVDILIIFKKKVDKKVEIELKNTFKSENLKQDIDLNSISLKELEGDNFIAREGIYLEGFSLIKNRQVNETLGFSSVAIIKYDLKNIKGSKRIRFYYALQGRNETKGFLFTIGAKRFAKNVIICDYSVVEKLKSFFEQWNIEIKILPTLIPKRLKHLILK